MDWNCTEYTEYSILIRRSTCEFLGITTKLLGNSVDACSPQQSIRHRRKAVSGCGARGDSIRFGFISARRPERSSSSSSLLSVVWSSPPC